VVLPSSHAESGKSTQVQVFGCTPVMGVPSGGRCGGMVLLPPQADPMSAMAAM
jgi:hypothetical protein